jgi:hypothetical protein
MLPAPALPAVHRQRRRQKPIERQCTATIVTPAVNIENVGFFRRKVPAPDDFPHFRQDNPCPMDGVSVFLTSSSLAFPGAFV